MQSDRFIFDTPKGTFINIPMLQRLITFWASEINDQHQFLNDVQEQFLRRAYRASSEDIEKHTNIVMEIFGYSGIMTELIKPNQILNEITCNVDYDFGEVTLEWL
jgi:hypothetical protein